MSLWLQVRKSYIWHKVTVNATKKLTLVLFERNARINNMSLTFLYGAEIIAVCKFQTHLKNLKKY